MTQTSQTQDSTQTQLPSRLLFPSDVPGFKIPPTLGSNASSWQTQMVVLSRTAAPGKVIKTVVPLMDTAGAVLVYGPEQSTRIPGAKRDTVLLEGGEGGFRLTPLHRNRTFTSSIVRPGGAGQIFYFDRWGIHVYALETNGEKLGVAVYEDIQGAAFNPDGSKLYVRSAEHGLGCYKIEAEDGDVKLNQELRFGNLDKSSEMGAAVAYSTCQGAGHCVFTISGAQCARINFPQPGVTQFKILSPLDPENCPLAIACQPNPLKDVQAVYAGLGPYAYLIGKEGIEWRKVRIALDGAVVGANGVAFLDPDICLGWVERKLFAFRVHPVAVALPVKFRSRPGGPSLSQAPMKRPPRFQEEPKTPNFLAQWAPPDDMRIRNVQVLGGQILVYVSQKDPLQTTD